ncbi:hypothetical protein MPSEU_000591000 [Mayamaea pseudoterrestris]|nr:hypothetical protein MPSEU_000591000 [Mayamaea pseudoterrestris]
MLTLPLKACSHYELSKALSDWLDDPNQQVTFDSSNPLEFVLPKPSFTSSDCRNELLRLQALRNAATEVLTKSNSHQHATEEGGLEDLQEYHACLLQFEQRGFPTSENNSNNNNECNSITLRWKGAYPPHAVESHSSLLWERTCVCYNVAALLTHCVASVDKTNRDACKQAVKQLQDAARLLHTLQQLVSSQQDVYVTVDVSPSHLQFWIKFLTASAQDYIFRMVSLGADVSTKHHLLSKLAQSAHELYNDALQATQDARLQSELHASAIEWGSYCKANSMLCAAKAMYYVALECRRCAQWGNEICRLRAALQKLESCRDFLRSLPSDGVASYTLRECLAMLPVVQDRFHEADKDNLRVYHEEIPRELPDVEALQMAKMSDGLPENMLQPKRPMFVGL